MNRRSFLRWLGIAPAAVLAAPIAEEATYVGLDFGGEGAVVVGSDGAGYHFPGLKEFQFASGDWYDVIWYRSPR